MFLSKQDDDARWIEGARNGDVEAFEHLYRRYVRQVYGTCRRLLDNEADAEDMTQQVFVRAWERLGSFRGEGRLGGWLRRLAVNMTIDRRRALWRSELRASSEETETLAAAPGRASLEAIDLERAIMSLASGARRVLVLHDVEGLTHVEVSERLGVTVGTTKTQLFRARRALKALLK